MIRSIWRWSHLLLAIVSSLFLLIASISGAILSFEPIANRSQDFSSENVNELSIAQVVDTLKVNYLEVISIERDANDFFSAQVLTNDGAFETFYVDLATGKKTGEIIEQSDFFSFITTLHRSLFLDSTGRFTIGICACLLILLSMSGIILIFKRLKSFRSFVQKIEKTNFFQYAHISLGRLLFIPLLIIALSGSYLFLQRIEILPEVKPIEHSVDFNQSSEKATTSNAEIAIFKETKVAQLRMLEFPFSPDEEDYFLLKTDEKEHLIHQYSGAILSSNNYPFPTLFSRLSMDLHTGKSNRLWAIVLLITSLSIPFFIVSGFSMTIKRWKGKLKNNYTANESEFIILFGSENGGTKQKAIAFHKALLIAGKKSFITSLNDYKQFSAMRHLIIFTSTYGTGDAPANATKFLERFKQFNLQKLFDFSIVGFGSHAYPDFCNFAQECETSIYAQTNKEPFLPTFKIHNQSDIQFRQWTNDWSRKTKIDLSLLTLKAKQIPHQSFTVVSKTEASESTGDSYLMELKPTSKLHFQSGDLIGFTPPNESQERLYSIGKSKQNTVLLSIKKHEFGICSNYLHQQEGGNELMGIVKANPNFRLKKTTKQILFIANGTGIAPFIGMLRESKNSIAKLYWGGRSHHSFSIYESLVQKQVINGQLKELAIAYSREKNKEYVWHLIEKDAAFIANHLKNKGEIYICGSLQMEKDVLRVLEYICKRELSQPLNYYRQRDRIHSDCY